VPVLLPRSMLPKKMSQGGQGGNGYSVPKKRPTGWGTDPTISTGGVEGLLCLSVVVCLREIPLVFCLSSISQFLSQFDDSINELFELISIVSDYWADVPVEIEGSLLITFSQCACWLQIVPVGSEMSRLACLGMFYASGCQNKDV
jgi:hypothetical protein